MYHPRINDTHTSPASARPAVVAAPTTPFRVDGSLDEAGVWTLFHSVAASGVDAAFVAGSTGEFAGLADDERLTIIAVALEVFGPSRVFAHTGAPTTEEAVSLTARARDIGIEKIAAITPRGASEDVRRLLAHYSAIADAAAGADVYIYTFPRITGTAISASALGLLAEIPGIVGIKASVRDVDLVGDYVEATPNYFQVYSGYSPQLVEVAKRRAVGVVSGPATLLPGPFVALAGAFQSGDKSAVYAAQADVDQIGSIVGGGIGVIKVGLDLVGLPGGATRIAEPATAAEVAAITAYLVKQGHNEGD